MITMVERKLKWLVTVRVYLFLIIVIPGLNAQAQSWKWIAYGDTRSSDARHREVLQSIVNNTPDYRFMINVGDVVENGTVLDQWNTWQKACDDILGGTGQDSIPPEYMATPGNHDQTETTAGLANWNNFLSGQKKLYGNDGKYFVFDYENARFVIMDSDKSSMTGEQYTMLLNAIENNPKTWLFAFWHHPIFDFGDKQYEDYIHETWGKPLYQNGCDIMFMGHAHYYVRTKKLELNGDQNPPLDSLYGTVQVVTGNGGAPMDIPVPNHDGNGYMVEAYNTSSSQYGYTEMTVGKDTIRLRHFLRDGTNFDEAYYIPNPKTVGTSIDKQKTGQLVPAGFHIYQNYPNPFNQETQIPFQLPVTSHVKLEILNVVGRKMLTLFDGIMNMGYHKVTWNGMGSNGSVLPSGVYFYKIDNGYSSLTRKMELLR